MAERIGDHEDIREDDGGPTGGRYRVEVPGIPKEDTAQVSVQGKNIPMKQATVELADAAYLVTYLDYPAEAVAGLTPQQALANTRDGSAKGHRLVSDRTLTVSGSPPANTSSSRRATSSWSSAAPSQACVSTRRSSLPRAAASTAR